jgi:hypothetical protein
MTGQEPGVAFVAETGVCCAPERSMNIGGDAVPAIEG